jgi:class 3 adenylate cyclase/tetratricopeptide (TPR) repeat protein
MMADVPVVSASRRLGLAFVPRLIASWPKDSPTVRVIDGSLLLVDVSGYTALSERLAKRGGVGGELLAGVLDELFGGLLGIAASYGGDLLKFGGDALLLLFDGNDHEVRSVAAAWAMQRSLRRRVTIEDLGTLVVRASMGVAAGEIIAAAAGDLTELIVVGSCVDDVLRCEGAAEARQIRVNEAVARRLPKHVIAVDALGALVAETVSATTSLEPVIALSNTARIDALVRCRLGPTLQPPGSSHRNVTAAFVAFDGVSALGRGDLSKMAAGLETFVDAAQTAAQRYDVSIVCMDIGRDGGKAFITAGVLDPQTDGVERCALASLDIVSTECGLRIGAGVATGRVFVGALGSATQRAVAVVGDTINTAARVSARAEHGQVLATEHAMGHSSSAFTYEPIAPFPAKGKREHVRAGRIEAMTVAGQPVPDVEIVGRQDEIRRVLDAIDLAHRDHRPTLTLIEGVAGQGKTRLVQAVRSLRADCSFLEVQGGRYALLSPFFAVQKALLAVLDGESVHEWITRYEQIIGQRSWLVELPLDPESLERRGTARHDVAGFAAAAGIAWAELLAATGKKFIVFVEDAYWLDMSSAEFIEGLARSGNGASLAIVITRRLEADGWRPGFADAVVDLGPLEDEASTELVNRWSERSPLARDIVSRIVERAGGNPLFLRELVLSALSGEKDLPATVEALLGDAMRDLDPVSREMLNAAAVLGATSDLDVLEGLVGSSRQSLTRRLGSLSRFVTLTTSTFRFTHALVREAAYQSSPFAARRALHRRAAALYLAKPEPPVELVAVHHSLAGDHSAAWHSCRRAAERAAAKAAPREALAFCESALAAGKHLSLDAAALAEVREMLADNALAVGENGRSLAQFRLARAVLQPDIASRARLMLKETRAMRQLGRYTSAIRHTAKALAAIETESRAVRKISPALVVERGALLYRQGKIHEALSAYERSAWLAIDFDDQSALARSYMMIGTIRDQLGLADESVYLDRALTLFEQLSDIGSQAHVLNNLASTRYVQGDWPGAARLWRECTLRFRASGEVGDAALPELNLAELYTDQGCYDEAADAVHRADREFRAAKLPMHSAYARTISVLQRGRVGEDVLAEAYEVGAEATAIGASHVSLLASIVALEIALRSGAAFDSESVVADAAVSGDAMLHARTLRLAGLAAWANGDELRARDVLSEALRVALAGDAQAEHLFTSEAVELLGVQVDNTDDVAVNAATRLMNDLGVVASPVAMLAAIITARRAAEAERS